MKLDTAVVPAFVGSYDANSGTPTMTHGDALAELREINELTRDLLIDKLVARGATLVARLTNTGVLPSGNANPR